MLYLPCGIWYNDLVDHAIQWFQVNSLSQVGRQQQVMYVQRAAPWGHMRRMGREDLALLTCRWPELVAAFRSQTLYFLSSFFNQFGPNCTSFLVAGEVRGHEGQQVLHTT